MNDIKWRFPASDRGERKGISSGDTEAFKKSPFQAFAREVLQNSIDARDSDEEPTRVVFSEFDIEVEKLPDVSGLKDAIRRCKEFWAHKPEYVDAYEKMQKQLDEQLVIHCLRISDYNTTGLIGVESNASAKNKFLALTKGTGVSEKNGSMAGGSKGVGKNAVFLMSSIRTVYYSTHANADVSGNSGSHLGSIGVAELVSGYVDDNVVENRDYTQGTGYLCNDDLKNPLPSVLKLDESQEDRSTCFGTDIYVIGFTAGDDWEKEVINSILDSFMSTIVRGELEVMFNGKAITKDTVKDIVYDDSVIFKNQKANIVSQYRLLTDEENVSVYDVDTEYGSCQLYVLPYEKDEDELATHKCSMIRHPLMKIKDEPLGSSFRVSAMCIIGEGKLGELLRDIENPQHVDWEPKRISDKTTRKEMESVLKDIREQIKQNVIECLQIGDNTPLDPNGAGDFLPDADLGDSKNDSNGNQSPAEIVSVSAPKANNTIDSDAKYKNDDGNGIEPDVGELDSGEEGEVLHPEGENEGGGEGRRPGTTAGTEKSGDNVIFKRAKLSSVQYKFISTDRKNGKFRVIFIAPTDHVGCYLSISMLDDANNRSPIEIKSMKCNGAEIVCDDKLEYGPFTIMTNQKITLDVETNSKGYFGSEVKVICK